MVANSKQIEVTAETEALIRARVESGEFASPDQVLQVALRMMDRVTAEYGASLDRVRSKIERGLTQSDTGELLDGPAVMKQLQDDLIRRADEDSGAA